MVFIAINNEWLARDPFREYEIKKEETTRGFLTKEEIRMLMDGKLKNAKQELYRDLYLFCAFTGLSFSDMRNLREENIRTYFDNHEWININRQKTGVESNIRLLDLPRRIIEKYRGLCEDGRIFPVPHYMTCLYGIRAVAKRCGMEKPRDFDPFLCLCNSRNMVVNLLMMMFLRINSLLRKNLSVELKKLDFYFNICH